MTETYHNAPAKGCQTCFFKREDRNFRGNPLFWRCGRAGGFNCSDVINTKGNALCDNFSGWRPKPPRRSLRRWLLETFWE